MESILLMYLAAGAVAGLLAGLLGIGGGLVIVPMLVFCFSLQHLDPAVTMHLALGTSMASIIFTSVSSFRAHHRRGAVEWPLVRRIVLGIFVGTFLGSCLAARLSTGFLKSFFVLFLYYVATQMLLNTKPKPSRQLPGNLGTFAVGNVIGAFSSLVGIGGGTLSVPFMTWCNVPVHRAIGTSAAIGFPIAIAGTVGYVVNGWHAAALPPIGRLRLSAGPGRPGCHQCPYRPVRRPPGPQPAGRSLKRVFAVLLFVVGTRMLISLV